MVDRAVVGFTSVLAFAEVERTDGLVGVLAFVDVKNEKADALLTDLLVLFSDDDSLLIS